MALGNDGTPDPHQVSGVSRIANDNRIDPASREIWIVQSCLAHYRTPVFDRLAERVREKGFTLKVVFDPNELEGPADANRPYCDPFIRLHEYRVGGVSASRMIGLLGKIKARRPAAVIVEGRPAILTNLALPYVIRRTGGIPLAWVKGHISGGTPEGYVSHRLRRLSWLRRRFLEQFDGIICYGQAGREELEGIGISPEKITIAQNTIDTARIFEQLPDLEELAEEFKIRHGLEGRRVVLSCGTMYRKKRQLDIVEAWPSIHAEHPDAMLVLVGGGEMFESIKTRVTELGDDSIRLTGRVPEGDDYKWIGACDVSVMCGGLGLAIQQTLAFGRPMVVADEPGVDGEVVVNGETGWRYPRGDVSALAATVSAVLSDPAEASEVAYKGQELIRNNVNIDTMVEGFIVALDLAGVGRVN